MVVCCEVVHPIKAIREFEAILTIRREGAVVVSLHKIIVDNLNNVFSN